MKLLKKEFSLCMHPTGYLMPLLSVLVLVPGYPYGISCFYVGLAIFFICLTARENHDAAYTLSLPVSREDAVKGRMVFCLLLEAAQLVLMAVFILVKYAIGFMPNPAGLDAGLALIGEGFVMYAIFNMLFFPRYFRDINKPGMAFAFAAVGMGVWTAAEIAATYAVPFVHNCLDQPDPAYMTEKALFTLGGFALFAAGTWRAMLSSMKRFGETDLSL